MTYSAAARYWYAAAVILFSSGMAALDFLGLFAFVWLVIVLLLSAHWYVTRFILVCPDCREYLGKFRFGGYEPWLGPRCRYCGSDVGGLQVETKHPRL